MSKIEVGDRVAYSAKFLRSIDAYIGEFPFARGTVIEIVPLGDDILLATINWHNIFAGEKVNVKNLRKVSDLHLEPN